jgi:small subunit ribosomal protein S1
MLLSVSRAEEEQDWQEAEEYMENQEPFEGVIDGYNKGGLIVKLGRLRGFVPASQVSISRRRRSDGETPDDRWSEMVGEPIITRVIEVDQRRNRLILSERAASREARDALKERLISELQPGEVRQGTVISLADFGAFVDIGGADGLIHISEISWKRIDSPSEVLEVGQEVDVKVLSVDSERKRISLSLRDLESDPWDEIMESFKEGQLVEGTITKLTKFGAFAALKGTEEYEIEGLIHISELSDDHIEHPREVIQEGQEVAMRLINIDNERRRIGLSLKQVDSAEFTDVDWRTAMDDIEAEALEGIELTPADEDSGAQDQQDEPEATLEEEAEVQAELMPEPEEERPEPGEEEQPEGSEE